ncbi:MAG: DUF2254 family protein, partial [Tunicatimonas sp.]|uniref:DUF2254 family protein n=1 Tax=Tunicatimonas sp. TaxID=1940096 RepID=UPI003C717A87
LDHTDTISPSEIPNTQLWIPVDSLVSGYLHNMDRSMLLNLCQKMDIVIWMSVPWGVYVHQKKPIFRVNRQLTEKETQALLDAFIFETKEVISRNYAFGFKQLTEIALKAMSPGINDPGTAVEAIDRLTSLFARQMIIHQIPAVTDKQGKLRWIGRPILFEDLFIWCWTAIKNYTAQDTAVLYKLIEWLEIMIRHDESHQHSALFSTALSEVIDHMDTHAKGELDRQTLNRYIRQLIRNFPEQSLNDKVRKKVTATDALEIHPY